MDFDDINKYRLSDRVLFALNLALEQKDIEIADKLAQALELSMTRNSGGGEFVERRNFPKPISDALIQYEELRSKR